MTTVTALGIDLAKNVFQVHGVDGSGRTVVKRKLSRSGLSKFVGKLVPCLIGVEASCGARAWVRQFKQYGHDARMIPAQFVKPFVKSDKNDANDAEAICEAVQRPGMRFVAEKTLEQQGIQMRHRMRSRRVASRTQLCNELRADLADLGMVVPGGLKKLHTFVLALIANEQTERWLVRELQIILEEWAHLEKAIEHSDQVIEEVFDKYPVCRRLATIPGVGKLTASAIIGTVPSASNFKSGRHLSAWLGLVPRQHSTGGKTKLSSITKRGDTYLRTLLIHGARAVIKYADSKDDKRSRWITEKIRTRGKNRAAVALANKNARVIWKILGSDEIYRVA